MVDIYIKVRLTAEEKKIISDMALKSGMNVSDYVKFRCLHDAIEYRKKKYGEEDNKRLSSEMIPEIIIKLIDKLPVGSTFKIKEVLAENWNLLSNGEKKQLGKLFNNQVINKINYKNVEFLGKGQDNNALYKKVY